jgi:hypothetical protein
VTAERNSGSAEAPASHAISAGLGRERLNSETTFVSRRYTGGAFG